MLQHILLPCLLLLAPSIHGAKWDNLKTTWGPVPGINHYFEDQPRTQKESEDAGWVQIGSCDDTDSKFTGNRFARTEADNDMVLIFDSNGYIAGMQFVVPVIKTIDSVFNFAGNKFYQTGKFLLEDVYFTTAYFVEPEIICDGGRSPAEFEEEGTGRVILFQTGDSPDQNIAAPLTEEEAEAHPDWFEHFCFVNMGNHWLQYDPANPTEDCSDLNPLQIFFHFGKLNGFLFQHLVNLDGPRWERPPSFAVDLIVNNYPQCAKDLADQEKTSTLHVYVSDYLIGCLV